MTGERGGASYDFSSASYELGRNADGHQFRHHSMLQLMQAFHENNGSSR
jgi:hypothetical protein